MDATIYVSRDWNCWDWSFFWSQKMRALTGTNRLVKYHFRKSGSIPEYFLTKLASAVMYTDLRGLASGNISEIVKDRDMVATDQQYNYGLSLRYDFCWVAYESYPQIYLGQLS